MDGWVMGKWKGVNMGIFGGGLEAEDSPVPI